MTIHTLHYKLTAIAHNANLDWGKHTQLIVDDRAWYQLSQDEKQKKAERFLELSGHVNDITPQSLHTLWRKTAPLDHPSNKDWGCLSFEEKFKDKLYLSFLQLYIYAAESQHD